MQRAAFPLGVPIAAALVAAVFASGCGAGSPASAADSASTGVVRITQRVDAGAYRYGAVWHVSLEGPAAFRGSFGGTRRDVTLRVPAGTEQMPDGLPEDNGLNRVTSYDRPCADFRCSHLGKATARCSMAIGVKPDETLELEVRVARDQTCTIERVSK